MRSPRWLPYASWISAGLALALVLALLPAPAQAFEWSALWPKAGSGQLVSQTYAPPYFDAVELRTRAAVQLQIADREAVSVNIDDNLVPLIDVYVRQRVLVIEDHRAYQPTQARVLITAPVFVGISAAGTTAVNGHHLVAPRLRISASDRSAIALEGLAAESLAIDGSDRAAVKVAGVANEVALGLAGDAAVDASGLQARRVTINASERAAAVVAAERVLKVNASGSASVRYYGSPVVAAQADAHASVARRGDLAPVPPLLNRR